jgi:hypothetical protein
MRLVILETPYAGDIERNTAFARACLSDSLRRGEAPLASHLLYTQPAVLNENIAAERELGMRAGHVWYRVAEACVVYTNLGISRGMEAGMIEARFHGVPIEQRIHPDWQERA